MKSLKLVLLVVLAVALAAVTFQNQQPWEVRFFWLSGTMPGIILLFLTAMVGFVAGIIATLLLQRGAQQRHSDKNPAPGQKK